MKYIPQGREVKIAFSQEQVLRCHRCLWSGHQILKNNGVRYWKSHYQSTENTRENNFQNLVLLVSRKDFWFWVAPSTTKRTEKRILRAHGLQHSTAVCCSSCSFHHIVYYWLPASWKGWHYRGCKINTGLLGKSRVKKKQDKNGYFWQIPAFQNSL